MMGSLGGRGEESEPENRGLFFKNQFPGKIDLPIMKMITKK